MEEMDRRDVENNKVGFAEIFNIVFEKINNPMIFPATQIITFFSRIIRYFQSIMLQTQIIKPNYDLYSAWLNEDLLILEYNKKMNRL